MLPTALAWEAVLFKLTVTESVNTIEK